MGTDKDKTTTTIDINTRVLAEFSYIVNITEKSKKRNDVIENFMVKYNNENRKKI